jgi:acetyl/propionyl-CoA carboxylase alpha subunit/acetyl-CoA carboxylase carboxyltransferase component
MSQEPEGEASADGPYDSATKNLSTGNACMTISSLLIANRSEIAIRIARAATDAGIRTVAVYSEDDARSLHVRRADAAVALKGTGPAAYLDAAQLIGAAKDAGCDAIHPGYGFLSESAAFARAVIDAGLTFVGPGPAVLEAFGDKARAREMAAAAGVPILRGTGPVSLDGAREFLGSLGDRAVMVKAVAGGGGRGMRLIRGAGELEDAYSRCSSEARAAFGSGDLYLEEYMAAARHIEVQVAGDGHEAIHLWERDCSIQRRNQKVIEIAPAPGLPDSLRTAILDAALRMARECRYDNVGTFEFLVDVPAGRFAFIEANARLQVEHTITEEVTGIDLVQLQLRLAGGEPLGLAQAAIPAPLGHAIQLRVNMETLAADGTPMPAGGTLTAFEPPAGPGVRVDTFGYGGYTTNPRFDSLLAKVIVHTPSGTFADALARARRALVELRVEGVETNAGILLAALEHPELTPESLSTSWLEDRLAALRAEAQPATAVAPAAAGRLAGARIDASDPLAVLQHGKAADLGLPTGSTYDDLDPGAIPAPLQGTIVSIDVRPGDVVRRGQQLMVMEAMKMEHVIAATSAGRVLHIGVSLGDAVFQGHPLLTLEESDVDAAEDAAQHAVDLDRIRPDLEEVLARHEIGLDAARPDAVARRRKTGQRTARENIEDLCDAGTFMEYGPLVIAPQRRRRPLQELIEKTPADGMVAGIGSVNGDVFDEEHARCILMSYDYTVLAGTQGGMNHKKKDRMFELAEEMRIPVVFFTEGGGGRPGDTDGTGVAGLDCLAFNYYAKLSGLVPLVGITSGRCFAGNAALLGCCDVVIATKGSNIGMGGPAMIEGGGLGIFRPEEVGPMDVQVPNGVVDIAVEDEAEAVAVTRKYLSYFQGPVAEWECADQRELRHIIPENRLRIYDVRKVIETLADTGSVLELRRHFGLGMVTAFIRVEGRPLGVVANNPTHLAGAIDSDGADKAARFIQLCDAFDIPILFLCDTPGIMVGPEVEKTALVRHASRLFVTAANITVPFFTIVLRKGYGLGAQAMAGGSFKAPIFTISWPTGEFGGMGLEGAVKLGYRNELAAIEDPEERRTTFQEMVDRMYQHGKAVNMASHFEIDDVIDPSESRRYITRALKSSPPPAKREGKKRPNIDTW